MSPLLKIHKNWKLQFSGLVLIKAQGKQKGTTTRACIVCVSHEHKLIIIVGFCQNFEVILKCAINIYHRKDNTLGEGAKAQSLPGNVQDLCRCNIYKFSGSGRREKVHVFCEVFQSREEKAKYEGHQEQAID